MFAIILSAIGGLVFGSFANVVIYRVPERLSIVRPASRCPRCETPIRRRDNIPIVSWLLLKGRCRECGAPIPLRYPIVELAMGGAWALTAARLDATDLIAYLPLAWVLIVLSAIDIDHKLLPNRIVLPSIAVFAALSLITAALGPGLEAWVRGLVGGVVGFIGLLIMALISPRGMGMGDVKLAGLLGMALAYLSWDAVFIGFFLAFLSGALGGLALVLARRGGMKSQIPFGPYLALGTMLGVWFSEPIARAWLG